MEMTIKEIIQGIEVIKAQAEWDYPLDWQIVLDGAIDTMRKYQKIKEIYDNWNVDFGIETHRAMNKIGEVLNGNND